jgi:DNA polymerase I-like protein with 3'-5' exonuclease and polymerase domains
MRVIPMVADMMGWGIRIDRVEFGRLSTYFAGRMEELEREITELTGAVVNPGSAVQVAELLYRRLRLEP